MLLQSVHNLLFRGIFYVDLYSDPLIIFHFMLTISTLFIPYEFAKNSTPINYRRLKQSPSIQILLVLTLAIPVCTCLISTVPHIPWLNFISHILGYVAMFQLMSLWIGLGFPKVGGGGKATTGLKWGVGPNGKYEWLTPLRRVQVRRFEGVRYTPADEVAPNVVDVGRNWGEWNISAR